MNVRKLSARDRSLSSRCVRTVCMLAAALAACAVDESDVGGVDAHVAPHDAHIPSSDGDSTTPMPSGRVPSVVDDALIVWAALTQQKGTRYWYDEINCVRDAGNTSTVVQVDGDKAEVVSRRTLRAEECPVFVDRTHSTTNAATIPALYGGCQYLLTFPYRQHNPNDDIPPVFTKRDGNGVLTGCYSPKFASNCLPPCGYGYWLREFAFGDAPRGADAGVDAGAVMDTSAGFDASL